MPKPMAHIRPLSTADRVATLLRERILGTEEDTYLGSEGDLATEIGVSLPTLRQAARMLEYEQLLRIKPGKGGGYFSRRPDIETAIKSASQYLSSKDLISNAMFMDSADPVVTTLVQQAACCQDEKLREELLRFIESQRGQAQSFQPPEESFRYSAELMALFARMSGNVLLELFARILWNEVSLSRSPGNFSETQEIMHLNYTTRLSVAEAVHAGDKKGALKAWQERSGFLRSWPKRGFNLTRPYEKRHRPV